jgi:haloacetate dehalogenase
MSIFPGFTLTDIETSGARIRLRHGGNGPPLLLLHGNPLTHVSWHKVAPRLAEHFHVVAADLRGYGDSSAPPEEPGSVNYSFRAMAQDQVEVMAALGHSRFFVAGHDRGGRTTHRKLKLTANLNHIPPAIWDEYVRCFNEKTIRGSCADYRAAATIDCELDTADLHRRLAMPVLVLWGNSSSVGRRFADPLALWRQRADDVRGEALPSGHYVNEEAPEQVLTWFLRFFRD